VKSISKKLRKTQIQKRARIKDDSETEEVNPDKKSEKDTEIDLEKIKSDIDKKLNKTQKSRGFVVNKNDLKSEKIKEDPKFHSVKKVFLAESVIEQAKTPDELKKLLGINREEIERMQFEKRKNLVEFQKDMYSLPENLMVVKENKDDHVDNIVRLSAAGLIEVPITLEQKLKNAEDTEKIKQKIMDNKLEEELDYLKVLKKLGPSYAKGYKNDLSHKTMTQLKSVFENVFVNPNSRKRKFIKERTVAENRNMEREVESYIRRDRIDD